MKRLALSSVLALASACGSADESSRPPTGDSPPPAATAATASHPWDRASFLAGIDAMPDAKKRAAFEYAWGLYDAADVRHSFTGAHGETVDCIVTAHQPSLRLPDGSFQPIELPPGVTLGASTGPCPSETIPRTRPDAQAFSRWLGQSDPNVVFNWWGTPPYKIGNGGYEHSRAVQSVNNQGVYSTLSVYRPSVATSGEHSISQVWVMGQSGTDCANGDSSGVCQSVEAGWNVDPAYGDTKPHFFIYSTSDNYRTSTGGCWAPNCPSFVLLNQGGSAIIPGSAIGYTNVGDDPVSHELAITVTRQASNSGWYIWVNADLVGYFLPDHYVHFSLNGIPATLKVPWFTSPGLRNASNLIRFGGEIINLNVGGKHTTTRMGTGNPASGADGTSPAAYQRYLYWLDGTGTTHAPNLDLTSGTNDYGHPGCYSMSQSGAHPAWWGGSQYVYFGGKGFDASTCK